MLNKDAAAAAQKFLERVNLAGAEVPAYCAVMNGLQQIIDADGPRVTTISDAGETLETSELGASRV
ncbi:hypothetical protein [Aureimonas sp. D3]|uniref:hypothetical protein n=1 Tax=Aureimonas sp. D3 TaxID=1638164 RepID=UPI0007802359|nr:hypothetical protein [Aureimonas sp. D3]